MPGLISDLFASDAETETTLTVQLDGDGAGLDPSVTLASEGSATDAAGTAHQWTHATGIGADLDGDIG